MDSISVHSNDSITPSSQPSTTSRQPSASRNPDAEKNEHKRSQFKARQQKTGEFIKELKLAKTENGKQIRKLNTKNDELMHKVGDMQYKVGQLEDERTGLINNLTTVRITNNEITEQLAKSQTSRQNYKDNFIFQKELNDEINGELCKANDKLTASKAEVTKWQHQASCERKKRKTAELELAKKRHLESTFSFEKSGKAKEFWKKQTGGLLHDFASVYSKWLAHFQNHSLENDLELPSIGAKKSRMCYPESPDSR